MLGNYVIVGLSVKSLVLRCARFLTFLGLFTDTKHSSYFNEYFQYRETSEILPIRISVYIFSISSNKSKHLTMTHMQMNCSQTTAHSIYSSIFPSREDSWDHTIFSNFFLSRDVIASHDVTLLVSFSPARTQLQLHITQLKIDTTCMITIAA